MSKEDDLRWKEDDKKRLAAIARAHEVFNCLDLIARYRATIRQLLANHDPSVGDNARRRDCDAFEARLRELALWDRAQHEAKR